MLVEMHETCLNSFRWMITVQSVELAKGCKEVMPCSVVAHSTCPAQQVSHSCRSAQDSMPGSSDIMHPFPCESSPPQSAMHNSAPVKLATHFGRKDLAKKIFAAMLSRPASERTGASGSKSSTFFGQRVALWYTQVVCGLVHPAHSNKATMSRQHV